MVWGVLQFPGSCDERDALNACRLAGGEARLIWHGDDDLTGLDAIVVPGGFSYGDYLRTGAIARFSPVMASQCPHHSASMCSLADSYGPRLFSWPARMANL